MLVGSRVKDNRWPICFENGFQLIVIPYGTDEHAQSVRAVFSRQLLLQVVGVVLVNIKDNQLRRLLGHDLTAKLRTDGTAAARYQDDFVSDKGLDAVLVDLYGLPADQILQVDFPQILAHHSRQGRRDFRQNPHAAAGIAAQLDEFALVGRLCRWNGDDNLFNFIFGSGAFDHLPVADDFDAAYVLVLFVRIVVDDADHFVVAVPVAVQLVNQNVPRTARADDHGPSQVFWREITAAIIVEQPQGHPAADCQQEQKQHVQQVVASRHVRLEHQLIEGLRKADHHHGLHDPDCIGNGHEGPHAVVQVKEPEHAHCDQHVQRHEAQHGNQIICRHLGDIKTHGQRTHTAGKHDQQVDSDQNTSLHTLSAHRHTLPPNWLNSAV